LEINQDSEYERTWTAVLWNIIPLPLQPCKNTINMCEQENMKKSIHRLAKQIVDGYQTFTSQFKNLGNAILLIHEWHGILRSHHDEFQSIVETTSDTDMKIKGFVKRMRNYFYQLLVDYNYQHIHLKTMDFHNLIVTCYLWSIEYQSLVTQSTTLFSDTTDKADDIFLAMTHLFLNGDHLQIGDEIAVHSTDSPTPSFGLDSRHYL
jgi:hypothetical protein